MSNESGNQNSTPSFGLFAPENRIFIFIVFVAVIFLSVGGFFLYGYLTEEDPVDVTSSHVDASGLHPEASAKTTETYKQAMADKNRREFDAAKSREHGVALTFAFDEDPAENGDSDNGSIGECECQMSESRFREMLERVGGYGSGNVKKDAMQVAGSDIYLSTKLQLVDENGEPLLFRAKPISMDKNGALLDENGVGVLSSNNEVLYLSDTGEVLDSKATRVRLRGELVDKSGKVILGSGEYATRPGNMKRAGVSDIYISRDGQLLTLDGRGIRHSGDFVFRSAEKQLLNAFGAEAVWNKQAVYQNNEGQLVNITGTVFKTNGILFSYDGILIDNNGKLTQPLVEIERLGKTDIFRNKRKFLVDANGIELKHYGASVKLAQGDLLVTSSGGAVRNRQGSEIFLNQSGKFVSDVGGGPVQTGFIKSHNKGAYNASGSRIGKNGSILRRGSSDIYTAGDGFLSDSSGKSIQFYEKDTFLDFDRTLTNGSQGLVTYDNKTVQNSFGEDVFLTVDGSLINEAGEAITDVGLLADADGVLLTADGKKVLSDSSLERVTTKDGKPVTLNGKEVYRGADGALYDGEGNPLLSGDGKAIFMDENGRIVDEFGREIPGIELRAGDREIQNGELTTRKAVTTGTGEAVFFDGKKVYTDASGRLVNSNGKAMKSTDGRELFLDRDGNIVDASGAIVDEELLITRSGKSVKNGLVAGREQVVTKSGGVVTFGGKTVYKGKDGALFGEEGNAITDSNGERLYIDDDGNIVNARGEIVEDTGLRVNGEELVFPGDIATRKVLTDKNGNMLTYNGESVYRGQDGRLYDMNNKAIKTSDGRDIYVDEAGNLVDSRGRKITEDILTAKTQEAVKSGELDFMEALLNSDGSAVTMNGKTVYVGKDGKLYDENDKELKDDSGSQMFLNDDGTIVNEEGDIASASGLSSNGLSQRSVRDGELTTAKKLTDDNGNALTFDGKDVFVDEQGRIIDEDGNLVRDSNGNVVYYDEETGNVVDASGVEITEDLLKNADGEYVKDNIKAGPKQVISKSGGVLRVDGKEAFVSADGSLVDKDGNELLTSDGRKMFVDENGNVVDKRGRIINDPALKVAIKKGLQKSSSPVVRDLKDGELTKAKKLTDKSGKSMKFRGKDVFVDEQGRVIDSDGNVVTNSEGNEVYFDEKTGELVDISGRKIKEKLLTDSKGRLVNDNIVAGAEQVISKNGSVLTVDGKEAFVSADGSLVNKDGKALLTSDGRKMFVDEDGNIVDREGKRIDDHKLKVEESSTSNRLAVSKDGGVLEYQGEKVFVDKDGFIVDANGEHIRSENGERIKFDRGNLVSESGRKINDEDFSIVRSKSVNSGIGESLEQLVTKDSEVIQYKGEEVYKDKNGRLVTDSGEPVLTEDGREVYVNDDGTLVDIHGNVVEEPLLTSKSGLVKSGDLTTVPVSEMRRIGGSDLYVAKDGSVLDSKGRAITYNGKRVKVNENGALIDEDGNIVTDNNGNAVFMDKDGKLVDKRGRPIKDSVLSDGEGVLLGADGKSVASKIIQVGGSDLYTTEGGRLVDRDGKAIKFNGQDVYLGEDGRLRYSNGQLVTDEKGRSVFLNEAGELVDKDGDAITGNILTDSKGVLIDSKGEKLNSGGKLTRIEGTDYYRTENGQVVTADGKPAIINGKKVYVDKDERLVTPAGRAIRYKGKDLYLGDDNRLVTADGNGLKDGNKQLFLGEEGIVDEDGVNINNKDKGKTGFTSSATDRAPVKKKLTSTPEPKNAPATDKDLNNSTPSAGADTSDPKTISLEGNPDATARFKRRYANIKAAMGMELAGVDALVGEEPPEIQSVGYTIAAEPTESAGSSQGGSSIKGEGDGGKPNGIVVARAGTSLYGINAYKLNSDYSNRVIAEIVGRGSKSDPLYDAKALGKFERKYKKLVLTLDKVCTKKHGCIKMDALAIDVKNAEVGLASDVDNHFWYRYGGLFAATLLAGISEAASESGTREESFTPIGSRVTTTGLDDDALIARSFGRTGETFTEVLAGNITRPPTALLDSGEEMALILFDDIVIPTSK